MAENSNVNAWGSAGGNAVVGYSQNRGGNETENLHDAIAAKGKEDESKEKKDRPKVGVGVFVHDGEGNIVMGERVGSHGAGMYADYLFVLLIMLCCVFP